MTRGEILRHFAANRAVLRDRRRQLGPGYGSDRIPRRWPFGQLVVRWHGLWVFWSNNSAETVGYRTGRTEWKGWRTPRIRFLGVPGLVFLW